MTGLLHSTCRHRSRALPVCSWHCQTKERTATQERTWETMSGLDNYTPKRQYLYWPFLTEGDNGERKNWKNIFYILRTFARVLILRYQGYLQYGYLSSPVKIPTDGLAVRLRIDL